MRKHKWLALAMVMSLAVGFSTVSCAKKTTQAEAVPPAGSTAENTPMPTAEKTPAPEPATPTPAVAVADEIQKPKFKNEKIYFDFDSALLSDEAREILGSQATYLRADGYMRLTVEGHCDERGTTAYNMALGQRRAEAVKKFLVDMGIDADRLITISYGEERPAVMGSNTTAWAQNRRVQFMDN